MPRKSDKRKSLEGYGQGELENYVPYIHPREFSSNGVATRVLGNHIKRQFNFLSNLEKRHFFLHEFSGQAVDYWEQCKLELETTQAISVKLGIKHPKSKGEDVVMTTDLVVTFVSNGEKSKIAYSVKPSSAIKTRTLEKCQIEKTYWNELGILWYLITERQLPTIGCRNVEMLREYFNSAVGAKYSEELISFIRSAKGSENLSLNDVAKSFARSQGITNGNAKESVLYLFAHKRLRFNLTKEFNWDMNLNLVTL
jgi:hypothetical protein